MPELPEVERVAKLLREVAQGRSIVLVETAEDTIVYTGGISHSEFSSEIINRKVTDVGRFGKVFYIELDGDGRMPVLHLGMTGMMQVHGQEPAWYRRRPKDTEQWPPRFMKFILHLKKDTEEEAVQVAFMDPRRLGRIRLCKSPLKEPPISDLGFDPILSMPDLETFSPLVKKRNCPIKALLLDQSFSAGVGNWVADEVLYQSRVHPEQRASTLTDEQISKLWEKIVFVCQTAVNVDADSSRFPADWLFRYRWGKGQKGERPAFILPSGEEAKIKWMTVGGRTSAVVEQMQILPKQSENKTSKKRKRAQSPQEEEEEEEEEESVVKRSSATKPKSSKPAPKGKKAQAIDHDDSSLSDAPDESPPPKKNRKKTTVATKVVKTSAVKKTSVYFADAKPEAIAKPSRRGTRSKV